MVDSSHAPSEEEFEKELTKSVEAALARLPAIGARVLRLYFGLDGSEPMTFEEIALAFGTDPDDVRRIKEESLAVLRTGPTTT